MKIWISLAIISFVIFCTPIWAQQKEGTIDTIPFVLTEYNNIYVYALLNHKDSVKLMFHTAVSDVSITEEAVKGGLNIRLKDAGNVESWGGSSISRASFGNTLQIGKTQLDSVFVTECKYSGHYTEGKFGPDFFGDRIIEINYDLGALIIHTKFPKKKNLRRLKADFKPHHIMVHGSMTVNRKKLKNTFMLHSGYSKTILFDDVFVAANEFNTTLTVLSESELKDSYGNVLKTKEVTLPLLVFGKKEMRDLPVGIFEGAISRQKISILGAGIMKQFNWLIDRQKNRLFVNESSSFVETN